MEDHCPGFTTLDRLLCRVTVDSAQQIHGALSEGQIDDLVEEVLHLNGQRHQSCFHDGFRDALFGREPRAHPPGEDSVRARWYWAGVVNGWARSGSSESWEQIAKAYDTVEWVRRLGGGDEPSAAAVGHVVEALGQMGRSSELTTFVDVAAVERSPALGELLLDIATRCLRAWDADAALPILERLLQAEGRTGEGHAERDSHLFLAARRRKAHCLRQLGDHEAARALLYALLASGLGPDMRAMVHCDLGLLDGGFGRLVNIYLPDDGSDAKNMLDRIRAGEAKFREGVKDKVPYAAHGHYCLGVLALGDEKLEPGAEEYESAERHLATARIHFQGRQDAYPPPLAARTSLYLGIARTQQLDPGRIARGADLIVEGLKQGADFPAYLVERTLNTFDLDDPDRFTEAARSILDASGDSGLDAIVTKQIFDRNPVVASTVARALEARADRESRGAGASADDLRNALRGYAAASQGRRHGDAGDDERAGQVFDRLDILAREGVGVTEFVEILSDRNLYEVAALSPEDASAARARCMAHSGACEEAAAILSELFHQYATKAEEGDVRALHNAAQIISRIKGYSLELHHYKPLEERYEAMRSEAGYATEQAFDDDILRGPVNIFVIGGDEMQERQHEHICDRIERLDEEIKIEFLATGWTSNWNKFLDKIDKAARTNDAFVIMRFIRTHLSKKALETCRKHHIEWRFCWGGGRKAIQNTIIEAARAGRAAKQSGARG